MSQHFAVAGRAFRTHETSNGYDYDSDYHYDDEYDYDYDDDDYDYDYEPGLSPRRVRPGVSTVRLPFFPPRGRTFSVPSRHSMAEPLRPSYLG